MLSKVINVNGKEVAFRASATIPRLNLPSKETVRQVLLLLLRTWKFSRT